MKTQREHLNLYELNPLAWFSSLEERDSWLYVMRGKSQIGSGAPVAKMVVVKKSEHNICFARELGEGIFCDKVQVSLRDQSNWWATNGPATQESCNIAMSVYIMNGMLSSGVSDVAFSALENAIAECNTLEDDGLHKCKKEVFRIMRNTIWD